MLNRLNNYHPNIKLIIELNPSKSLDSKRTNMNGFYKFSVDRKSTKPPSPWTSKTPKRYKRTTINGDLHRTKRISSNFDEEIHVIKEKFKQVDHLYVSLTVQLMSFKRIPVDTGRNLNVYKAFRRRLGHLLNVLCTFNLRPVSTGI